MLRSLSIKNYALIDSLSIQFEKGFSVITGETGAGKSILLGALAVILGKRADTAILSKKSSKCIIEGVFDISALDIRLFFDKNDLDYESTTIVRREILPSGKSRAFINDTPVTLGRLKELGSYLVDIHSQHQTLMLSNSEFQLEALDGYLGNSRLISLYRTVFNQYSILQNRLKTLLNEQTELKKEEDFLTFQFEELNSVLLEEVRFREMEERQQFLTHSGEVLTALNRVNLIISDDEHSLLDGLSVINEKLSSIEKFYPKVSEILNRIESIKIELKDIADEVVGLVSEGEVNPLELSELTEKLDEIYRLQQKHRVDTIGELMGLKDEISNKLLGISDVDEEIEKVSQELKMVTTKLEKLSSELTKKRKSGMAGFTKAVQKVLQKLGMKEAVFEVRLSALNRYTPTGSNRVDFWFSANKGVPVGEISKIASGGELSRLMLAIKSLVNENSFLPTMIFDEIDAGVSGDIAGKVGSIMQEMAGNHQLIVITHLPQIASKAKRHYKVFKQNIDGITRTNIMPLNDVQRIEEIASMLSDQSITPVARQAAKELLG